MFAVVLGLITSLFSQIKIVNNAGNSVSSFYSADSGVEKTLYLDRSSPQSGQPGIAAGFCGICQTCQNTTNDCSNCTLVELSIGGCNPFQCNNCRLTYSSVFDGRRFDVDATVTQQLTNTVLIINSRGLYLDATRTSWFNSSPLQPGF